MWVLRHWYALLGIETHKSFGCGKSFHRQPQSVYKCIHSQHPQIPHTNALSLAIKAMNDTSGTNGISPSQMVFGATPAFPLSPKKKVQQATRCKALEDARSVMARIAAEIRIKDALRRTLPPSIKSLISPGDKVRLYHEKARALDGPLTITEVNRKTVPVTDCSNIENIQHRSKPTPSKRCQRCKISTSTTTHVLTRNQLCWSITELKPAL